MKVFHFDHSLISSYARFSRSFSMIRADDLADEINRQYDEGRFWPDALLSLNPRFLSGATVAQRSLAKVLAHRVWTDLRRGWRYTNPTYTSHSLAPFARDLGHDGPPFVWDEGRRALLRAELDAFYARAYGLTRDELRYILDPADVKGPDTSETFRVLKEKEIRQHSENRTRRLILAAWDRMKAEGEFTAMGM